MAYLLNVGSRGHHKTLCWPKNLNILVLVKHYFFTGLPHEAVAKLIAERFAKRDKNTLTLVVMDQKLTPAEMRRSFMQPQN